MVSSREAAQSFGPRHIYRLSFRREQPDFRLVVMDNHVQNPGACTLWRGGSQHLEVTVFRRDGFTGPITLTAEDLPAGVSCPPQLIPPGINQGVLVLTASKDAPVQNVTFTVKGAAEIGGQHMTREARGACMLWPNPGEPGGVPAASRLTRKLYLAVQDVPPYNVELLPVQGSVAAPSGGSVALRVRVNRLWPGVATPITITGLSLPSNTLFNGNNQAVTIPANQTEVPLTFSFPPNVPPGTYSLAVQGVASVPYNKDPKNAQKPPVQVQQATPPVTLTVYNRLANVQVFSNSVMLKAGGSVELLVKVERLHGYNGPFKVQLVLPQGFAGVAAPEVIIPEGAHEGRFLLTAPAQAAAASHGGVIVRVIGTVGNVNLPSDAPISVTIMK
jgi:hypothetical protein